MAKMLFLERMFRISYSEEATLSRALNKVCMRYT